MTIWPKPLSVEGDYVAVEPLRADHESDLAAAVAEGDLHKVWYTNVPSPEGMAAEIEKRLALQQRGAMVAFAIIDKVEGPTLGKAVGMTTYLDIDAEVRRLEIGYTWYGKAVQRSPRNTECKLLLMRHAFEELDCVAVAFRTHFMNHQSRRAIERLGAKLDGVIRAHRLMPNGTVRDTAVYSIIASEWPSVKANLIWQLEKPRSD